MKPKKFTDEEVTRLKTFMKALHQQNWGTWESKNFPEFENCPGYAVNQYATPTGDTFEVIKFDEPVIIEGERDYRFKFGGGRNYNPICTTLRF